MTGPAGRPSRLRLEQTLRYDYPSPVGRLHHHLMVLPPAVHGDQHRISSRLEVRGATAEVNESVDRFGNVAVEVRAATVQAYVEFFVQVVVERHNGADAPAARPAPIDHGGMLDVSSLTDADPALAAAAGRLADSGDTGLALAGRVNSWVAGAMRYRHDVTSVRTTAAEALALGKGVCQDYAHVMIALCRLCHLPARYVSGHLVGEGGSHAWVEVLVAPPHDPSSLVAVAFDPTNDRRAGSRYLTVAVGRDYADVTPTHGTYSGPAEGRLTTSKSLDEEACGLVRC